MEKVPGKTDADEFIIGYAKKYDGFILTNDQFRDYLKENPLETEFIKKHRISFMIDEDGEVMFNDYKKIRLAPVVMDNELNQVLDEISKLEKLDS